MRKILRLIPWVVLLVLVGVSLPATAVQAATGIDLSMTGSTVAGVTGAQPGQEVGFAFSMQNKSTTKTAGSVVFTFTVTGGSADNSDYICPLITNHFNINPDTPACEPGDLPAGKTAQAAILVTPTGGSGTSVIVKACASSSLSAPADPVPSNNCKTLSLKIS
jgi:hypothetical protein